MIGRLPGHTHQATTARYAHLGPDPVDALNATIGATIAAAIGLTTPEPGPSEATPVTKSEPDR